MIEEGTLSIVRRGNTYQVRYASYNPYASATGGRNNYGPQPVDTRIPL